MVELRRAGRLICVILLLLIFQSCAQTKNRRPPTAAVPAPPTTTVQVPPASTVHAPSQTKQPMVAGDDQKSVQAPKPAPVHPASQIKPPITVGDYQKTINHYRTEYKKHPQDQELVKEYVKTLKEIKLAADEASRREDLAPACKTYNILLKSYPNFKVFANALSFDKAQLKTEVTNCKTALSKKGFQEYREGNLSEAILIWQDCLTIDPNNADIKKALKTAKAQQKNLQQTK